MGSHRGRRRVFHDIEGVVCRSTARIPLMNSLLLWRGFGNDELVRVGFTMLSREAIL